MARKVLIVEDEANIAELVNLYLKKEGYETMVAVYLLGHRVGDIEEPVLYVSHKSYDYDGHEVFQGLPSSSHPYSLPTILPPRAFSYAIIPLYKRSQSIVVDFY